MLVSLAALYVATLVIGFLVFVALFKASVLGGITVLFFRGLILSAFAFLGTFGLAVAALSRWKSSGLGGRDAFSAAIFSLSFNICFLVVVPVTVDRSISVFVLGEMNATPDHLYSADEMSRLFTTVYVGTYHQIERRLREQAITGNVEAIGDRYRISAQGRLSIATARVVVGLFGGDARLASPTDAGRVDQAPTRSPRSAPSWPDNHPRPPCLRGHSLYKAPFVSAGG